MSDSLRLHGPPLVPLSLGFPRQEYWSGLPLPPPGDLPNPGIKPIPPVSPTLQADSLPAEPSEKPSESKGIKKESRMETPLKGF